MGASFLDTNVLLYLAAADPAKADRAEALLVDGATISVQVLNEIAHVARRKMRLPWDDLRRFLALVRGLVDVVPLGTETHEFGLDLAQRHGFSTCDAMIVAAALLAGCETLWSEDLQHGMLIEGRLRIRNPFRAGA